MPTSTQYSLEPAFFPISTSPVDPSRVIRAAMATGASVRPRTVARL